MVKGGKASKITRGAVKRTKKATTSKKQEGKIGICAICKEETRTLPTPVNLEELDCCLKCAEICAKLNLFLKDDE